MLTLALAVTAGFLLDRAHAEWSRRRLLHRLIREQDDLSMELF